MTLLSVSWAAVFALRNTMTLPDFRVSLSALVHVGVSFQTPFLLLGKPSAQLP